VELVAKQVELVEQLEAVAWAVARAVAWAAAMKAVSLGAQGARMVGLVRMVGLAVVAAAVASPVDLVDAEAGVAAPTALVAPMAAVTAVFPAARAVPPAMVVGAMAEADTVVGILVVVVVAARVAVETVVKGQRYPRPEQGNQIARASIASHLRPF